jgi:hypothetical protein
MFSRSTLIFFVGLILATGCWAQGQSADNRSSIFSGPGDDKADRPKGFKETLEKMRIDREKKEFGEMIERGEVALKLSEELEMAYAQNGRLTDRELDKLATVEKLVKKIRSELGGDDDEEDKDKSDSQPMLPAEAVKNFRSTTVKLFDELKKTTRFSISAAAIKTSNAVLKLARVLRVAR